MINFWLIERLLLVKLFNFFKSSTVVLNLLAMEYSESPLFTVYIWLLELSWLLGMINFWLIERLLLVKLLIFFKSSTVVLNFLAIEYNESPLFFDY